MDAINYIDDILDYDLVEIVNNEFRDYNVRERINHFNYWGPSEFVDRFRLSKETVQILLNLIQNRIQNPTNRNQDRAVSPMHKLLLTLRFLATGSFYIAIGDFGGISKSSACKIIKIVISAICDLRPIYLKMPVNEEEFSNVKLGFYRIARFPRVIGVIDCTHIKIQSPGGPRAEIFRNRKGYFSLNCQIISDSKNIITNMVSRWPGSAHDSNILQNSAIYRRFQNNEMDNGILLGDSGYPLKNFLMTPLNNPRDRGEALFNESLIRTRNVVERTIGILKRRFPILSIGIRTNINLAQDIIITCAILHNIARLNNDMRFDDEYQIENEIMVENVNDENEGEIGRAHV